MKRDNELQKPVAHISIWLEKRESDFCIKMYGAQKAKGYLSMLKYQKFQAPISKRDVLSKKWSTITIYAKAKWKASKFCNLSLVGGHICSFL